MISDVTSDYSIGKLTKIIPNGSNPQISYWPMIQVQWYYRKKDIYREKNNLSSKRKFDSISDFEVFKSEHKDIIFIESILSKCDILSFEEYESSINIGINTFFTRYCYDPMRRILIPSFDKWKKACKCNLPLNPDQLYINCEICEKWYHPECCGYGNSNLDEIKFVCFKCSKSNNVNNGKQLI